MCNKRPIGQKDEMFDILLGSSKKAFTDRGTRRRSGPKSDRSFRRILSGGITTKMQIPIPQINPDYLMYGGVVGILLGLLFLLYFLYRRIRWMLLSLSKKKSTSPKVLASLRNLILIIIWTSVFGMLLFLGFFLRAYQAFTHEEPVAEVIAQPLGADKTSEVTIVQFFPDTEPIARQFLIRGDQWMLEGDILKWENWLNFLGLHTRYRLTRLRGRYLGTEEEINRFQTIYSLVEQENHPLWRYLYQYGHQLPFVSTVYGNAVFQASGKNRQYLIYVGTSGFIARLKTEK
jgi:hypothetical protein